MDSGTGWMGWSSVLLPKSFGRPKIRSAPRARNRKMRERPPRSMVTIEVGVDGLVAPHAEPGTAPRPVRREASDHVARARGLESAGRTQQRGQRPLIDADQADESLREHAG